MNTEKELRERSGSACELCGSAEGLKVYEVPPVSTSNPDNCVLVCSTCFEQITNPEKTDINHWRCLNDAIWSPVSAVQVTAWRLLNRLRKEDWAQSLLDTLYLDEETLKWAEAGQESAGTDDAVKHIDSNGSILQTGDTVVLIKDLDVRGATFTAKRGTSVRGISLVADNPEQIEGRVNGQQIVLLTKYVKKAG